jgi:MFS family permease
MVRMMQGLSVGGQLMSSLVFTVEGHPRKRWGFYGSCVMAAGNFGTFLGGAVAYGLRSSLTDEQLYQWGWRIPFLSGILISVCGIYLKYYCQDDEILPGHTPVPTGETEDMHLHEGEVDCDKASSKHDHADSLASPSVAKENPLRIAFSRENRRALLASAMVPMVSDRTICVNARG